MAMGLKSLLQEPWQKESEEKVPEQPRSIRVIKQQLWCCLGEYGIVIYNADLEQQRTIPRLCFVSGVYDVAEIYNGDLVMATEHELHHSDPTGKLKLINSAVRNKPTHLVGVMS